MAFCDLPQQTIKQIVLEYYIVSSVLLLELYSFHTVLFDTYNIKYCLTVELF